MSVRFFSIGNFTNQRRVFGLYLVHLSRLSVLTNSQYVSDSASLRQNSFLMTNMISFIHQEASVAIYICVFCEHLGL